MNTRDFQHNVLRLMKGHDLPSESSEAYFDTLKNSIDLEVMKDISAWWRCFTIERYCVLTSRLLTLTGDFEKQIRAFYKNESISPYIETSSHQFLNFLIHTSSNPLWVSMADFEDKLIKVRKGDEHTYTIQWAYEPYFVIEKLLQQENFLESQLPKGHYEMHISSDIENYFSVIPSN